jgi:lysophospholipid acyltransferase (LPLAT)-like uncharacterized protein
VGLRQDKIKSWLIINIGTLLLKIWFSTCRVKIIRKDLHERYIESDICGVGATWHRGALFMLWFFRKIHPLIMVSRSKDGELAAGYASRLGAMPVRGSSGKGGAEALKAMIEYFSKPGVWKSATPMDGPRGPRNVAKKGMLALAKETGTPILPMMVSAYPAITLKKTWDRTIIPMPFSKVTVMYSEPWPIPKDINEQGLEQLRKKLEDTLNEMMAMCDIDTGYNKNQ